MKKTLTTLGLAASLALSGAPKANAQIDKNNDETQHKIENVFTKSGKEAQNFMQDTTNIQEIKNLLKDEEFVRKLTNDERVMSLLKEYNLNEKDVEKIIEDIINSDNDTISFEKAQKFSEDTANIQEIKNLLKDEEFVRKLTNDERIKPLLKEYNLNEKDVEKFIEDIINSDVAIGVIKENLKNKDINKMEKKSDKKVLIIGIIGGVLLSLLLFFPELFVKRR